MNIIEPKTLPGFMELNPNEQVLFNQILTIIENNYQKYGFWPLDTPVIEYSEVLLAKAGGETEKQIYRFKKGENDLSLRFDLTVPLAKYVANRHNELVFPFKRYQIGKVFRGERPQHGRFREFYQCDIDIVGKDSLSILYDAEIPSIIYDIFKELNLDDFVIKINNRKILSGFFESLNITESITTILRIIDKLPKIGLEEVKQELSKLDLSDSIINKIIEFVTINGTNKSIIESLELLNINNDKFNEGIKDIKTVINHLELRELNPLNYQIDLTITRGLDYYTGTVYETFLTHYESLGSVCSGGRYDSLASYYTDAHLPGVGISIGLSRLFNQLLENKILITYLSSPCDVVIIPMINDYKYIYFINNILKNNNIKTIICLDEDKNFKQKLRYADRLRTKYIIIIGEDEVNNNNVTLKNMITGEQATVSVDTIIKENLIN